jgi:hypothetical protein
VPGHPDEDPCRRNTRWRQRCKSSTAPSCYFGHGGPSDLSRCSYGVRRRRSARVVYHDGMQDACDKIGYVVANSGWAMLGRSVQFQKIKIKMATATLGVGSPWIACWIWCWRASTVIPYSHANESAGRRVEKVELSTRARSWRAASCPQRLDNIAFIPTPQSPCCLTLPVRTSANGHLIEWDSLSLQMPKCQSVHEGVLVGKCHAGRPCIV